MITDITGIPNCKVFIVGAGLAGCMSALHLYNDGVRDIVLVDAGESAGEGIMEGVPVPDARYIRKSDSDRQLKTFEFANRSGSSVLPDPVGSIKMVINLYPCDTDEFVNHHGEEGARAHWKLARRGMDIEEKVVKGFAQLGQMTIPDDYRKLGSVFVGGADDRKELRKEYETLRELGIVDEYNLKWLNEDEIEKQHGVAAGFVAGIYFPDDAIVDSSKLCKEIVKFLVAKGNSALPEDGGFKFFNNVTVQSIIDGKLEPGVVQTIYQFGNNSAQVVTSDHVVVATGGLFVEPGIAGILSPRWSYLVGIKAPQQVLNPPQLQYPNSPNYFTWGHTHDWCMVNGHVRISAEDHFSAMKPPRMVERCQNLADWVGMKYPHLKESIKNKNGYVEKYGVYSETPDFLPIVGTASKESRVCYIMGCNACGQATLSYSSSLVPGLLGYKNGEKVPKFKFTKEQKEHLRLLSVRRFQLLPIVRAGAKRKSEECK